MSVEPIGIRLTPPTTGLLRRLIILTFADRASAMVTSTATLRRARAGFVPSGVLPIELCTLDFVFCYEFFSK